MTRTQLWISAIAIMVAIVNPWLVARSNRKTQQRAARAKPVKKEDRTDRLLDVILWILDIGGLVVCLGYVAIFVASTAPMTRVDVVIVAACVAIQFDIATALGVRVSRKFFS